MTRHLLPSLFALAALLLLLSVPAALAGSSMRARCSACRAVADVLTQKLEEEVPRNHLDMRHRLDKEGKRWGKVIDYKMSELRVIHLLEDLCDGMSDYELVEANGTQTARWARSADLSANRSYNMHMRKEQRKELANYCHDVLERHEDELSHALRNGEVDTDCASDFLCLTTAKHCDLTLAQELAQADVEAEAKAEADAKAEAEAGAARAEAAGGEEGREQQLEAGTAATATATVGSVQDEL